MINMSRYLVWLLSKQICWNRLDYCFSVSYFHGTVFLQHPWYCLMGRIGWIVVETNLNMLRNVKEWTCNEEMCENKQSTLSKLKYLTYISSNQHYIMKYTILKRNGVVKISNLYKLFSPALGMTGSWQLQQMKPNCQTPLMTSYRSPG